MIPRIFEGRTVAIIGGGPSLRGFDWAKFRPDHNVIAINRAIGVLPFAQVAWWADERFWDAHMGLCAGHPAPWKASVREQYAPGHEPAGVHLYRTTGRTGFDPKPDCLRSGNNSGYMCMHLAVHLGARKIVLFGFDMAERKPMTHWHEGYGIENDADFYSVLQIPFFDGLVKPLRDRGISVINACHNSALQLWPRCWASDGLTELDTAW